MCQSDVGDMGDLKKGVVYIRVDGSSVRGKEGDSIGGFRHTRFSPV